MVALAAATLVVCAPGFPGSTAEARPTMDAFANAVAQAGQLPAGSLSAVYEETEGGCVRRLAQPDAALVLTPLPFFLDHDKELRLVPRLSAVRRAADGDKIAVLLDGPQAASLANLPFASSLAVVSTSPPMPVAVLATIA